MCAQRKGKGVCVPNKGERVHVQCADGGMCGGRANTEKWLFNVRIEHGKKAIQCMGRIQEEKWLPCVCIFFYLLPCCPHGQQQFSNVP